MKALRLAAAMALIAAMTIATGIVGATSVPNVNSIIINPNPPYQSSIWTDKANYQIGERVNIGFRVNRDSFAYVFSIDASGVVRMIFPNIYSNDNRMRANQSYSLPDNNKYNLSIGGPAGTDQLVLISTPSKIKDTDWLRRSLEQNSFAPQINISITADGFMAQIKSIVITPTFRNDWSSAYTSYNVGSWVNVPQPVTPPIITPPIIVTPPVMPPVQSNGRINVTSNPSGARVFLNGIEQSATPVNFNGLKYGEYEITVIYPGCYTFTRTVTVNSSNMISVHAGLTALRNQNVYSTPIYTRQIGLSWPSVGPFTESFQHSGFSGSITIRGDAILGMITRVSASAAAQGVSLGQFAELAASGNNAAFVNRTIEHVFRPFAVRITVLDLRTTTGALTGSGYIESIRLYLEVFYVG